MTAPKKNNQGKPFPNSAGGAQIRRRQLLGKVHAIKKTLGWSDDTWRGVLVSRYQQDSSGKLEMLQLIDFANHLEHCQLELRKASGAPDRASQQQLNYLRLLWSKFARKNSLKSLESWLHKHFKVSRLEWLPRDTASKAITTLERETGYNA